MTTPVKGRYYRIKPNEHGIRVCDRPVKYTGTQRYQGTVHHCFFDSHMRLTHWVDLDRIEEAQS